VVGAGALSAAGGECEGTCVEHGGADGEDSPTARFAAIMAIAEAAAEAAGGLLVGRGGGGSGGWV
jgi:hypothetical protein